jgi:hypothetical protein
LRKFKIRPGEETGGAKQSGFHFLHSYFVPKGHLTIAQQFIVG